MEKITIKFIRNPNYARHHVTGLFGGLTPDGKKINIELYEDVTGLLPDQSLMIVEGNAVISEKFENTEPFISRHVHAGITIPLSEIPSFIKWLQQKYDEGSSANITN